MAQYESDEMISPIFRVASARQAIDVDGRLEEVDRAVGEQEVDAARVHAPVVLDMRLRIIGRTEAILQSRRAQDLGPALLGRRVELVRPSLRGGVTPSQPLIERAVQVT